MSLVEEVGFDHSFSFVFSPRPGTPAAALDDETGADEKLERLRRLQAKIEAQGDAISRSRLGTTQRILVEGASRRNSGEWMGRTACNRVVNFVAAEVQVGSMADVRISEVRGHSLHGELVVA
jgi:tRNA-2-methylthio-N6-dimethylallyladenosine synthase